uniref:Uncharacterized protein n=1 Tax=Rhizophora mucronata TaxID=61149 RepID=A0A2P2R4A4_RHIMU
MRKSAISEILIGVHNN